MDENSQNTNVPSPIPSPIPSPEIKNDDVSENVGMAVIAYIVVFIPLLTDYKNEDFVKFHIKQSLLIFVSYMVLYILRFFPFIGEIIWRLFPLINFLELALLVIGIFNALRREKKELPFIGKYADGLYNFFKKSFAK